MLGSIGVAGDASIDVAAEDELFSQRSVTGERIVIAATGFAPSVGRDTYV